MKVNVFDFDNTIYDGETLVDYIMYYIKHDAKIWKYVPKLIIIALKDKFHLFTFEQALHAYADFLEGYYVKLENPAENIVDFWDKNEHRIKPWYNEVRQDNDIIVSGTLDFILEEIAGRMGISRFVASSIDSDTGKFRRLCFLENKVTLFHEDFPNCEIENFYTDSMNDKAMMDIAENVYLVKKNTITKIK